MLFVLCKVSLASERLHLVELPVDTVADADEFIMLSRFNDLPILYNNNKICMLNC